MRKTLIALVAVTPLVALGATAFAAQPAATTGDELFVKAGSQSTVAEKAEPLKGVDIKKIRLGDDNGIEHGVRAEGSEMGEGMDD